MGVRGGREGGDRRRRRDLGWQEVWKGRQTQPRAPSGFLLQGSKPLHIPADLQTARATQPAAFLPLRYARPLPCLSLLHPAPWFTSPACVRAGGWGGGVVLGGLGSGKGAPVSFGLHHRSPAGLGPRTLRLLLFWCSHSVTSRSAEDNLTTSERESSLRGCLWFQRLPACPSVLPLQMWQPPPSLGI